MMKTIHNNDMTDCIGVVYAENEIDLSWTIGPSVVCD